MDDCSNVNEIFESADCIIIDIKQSIIAATGDETFGKIYMDCLNKVLVKNETNEMLEECINKENNFRSSFITNLNENKICLKNSENTIQKFKATEAEKKKECLSLEKTALALKDKVKQVTDGVAQQIKDRENEIMVYKLLTRTEFLYNTKKVKGFVSKGTSVVPFSFNPAKMSEKEITDALWKLVLHD